MPIGAACSLTHHRNTTLSVLPNPPRSPFHGYTVAAPCTRFPLSSLPLPFDGATQPDSSPMPDHSLSDPPPSLGHGSHHFLKPQTPPETHSSATHRRIGPQFVATTPPQARSEPLAPYHHPLSHSGLTFPLLPSLHLSPSSPLDLASPHHHCRVLSFPDRPSARSTTASHRRSSLSPIQSLLSFLSDPPPRTTTTAESSFPRSSLNRSASTTTQPPPKLLPPLSNPLPRRPSLGSGLTTTEQPPPPPAATVGFNSGRWKLFHLN